MTDKKEQVVRFEESNHTYWHGDRQLTSVTTFLQKFYKEFDRDAIAVKVAQKRGLTVQQVFDEWDYLAEMGTYKHALIERSLKGEHFMPDDVEDQCMLEQFWAICNTQNWQNMGDLHAERLCYSLKHGIAGQSDLVILDHRHKQINVFDWKFMSTFRFSSFKGEMMFEPISHLQYTKLNKYFLQLSLYAYLLQQEFPGYTVHQLANLVYIKGKFYFYPAPYMYSDIVNILRHIPENIKL